MSRLTRPTSQLAQWTRRSSLLAILAAAWLMVCFLLIYGRDIGHGFISDDFGWIMRSRIRSAADVARFFTDPPMGFYRPIVAISFGANEWITGIEPMAYAWVNVGLAIGTAIAIAALVRALGFAWLGGVFAAGLWVLNFHFMRMALLWTSGRTSLLVALFAAVAAVACAKRRIVAAACLTLCALLSKEEPVMLPVIFAMWAWMDHLASDERRAGWDRMRASARTAGPAFVALAIYAALRVQTTALTQATAPAYYKLTSDPRIVLSNALSYLDRSLTLTVAILLIGWLMCSRRSTRLEPLERRTVAKGAIWLTLGFAVTVLVPVRSSLYVCFPAIGASLIGVGVGSAIWRTLSVGARRGAAIALMLLPLALLPVYRARNVRTKAEAQLSTRVTSRIRAEIARDPGIQRIVIYDDAHARPTVASAFNWALPEAVEFAAGHPTAVELRTDMPPAGDLEPATLSLVLRNGDIVRLGDR